MEINNGLYALKFKKDNSLYNFVVNRDLSLKQKSVVS